MFTTESRRITVNAPIKWLGGKSRLRKQIIERIPEHTCYVEVFGGAAWVLFGKETSKVEVYNDIDGELVNFFRIIKTAHKAFVQAYDWILVSRRLFKDFINTSPDELDEVQRAVRFYYIIKCSFGGEWKSPGFGCGKTMKPAINLETLCEVITRVHSRLKRVLIEEDDFETILKRYDGPETVFYLDPPYYDVSGYRYNLKYEDYERLREVLNTVEGKFLMSINDHEAMREVYRDFTIEEVEVLYTLGKKKYVAGELLVRNY
jgi:DNA adenine methylase